MKPPALGAVKRQKRSWSGSRSSSVSRGAHGNNPVASKLAVWAESNPGILAAHTFQWMADQVSREDRGLDWRPVDCFLVATSHPHQILQHMSPGLDPRNLREVETFSEVMDQLAASQFGRAADVATQRFKAIEVAMQDGDWKRASHLELLPDATRLLTG